MEIITWKKLLFLSLCLTYIPTDGAGVVKISNRITDGSQEDVGKTYCKLKSDMDFQSCRLTNTAVESNIFEILDLELVTEGTECFWQKKAATYICKSGKWELRDYIQNKEVERHRNKRFLGFIVKAISTVVNIVSKPIQIISGLINPVKTIWCFFAGCNRGPTPNSKPSIWCSGDVADKVFYSPSGELTRRVSWLPATASDPEDGYIGVTQTQGALPGTRFGEGIHLITYMAKDSQGLMATCSFSFSVIVRQCPLINTYVSHGDVKCLPAESKNAYGNECTYTCDDGYRISGSDTAACLESESWSSPRPTCQAITCSKVPEVKNGTFDCDDPQYRYKSMCALTCSEGYETDKNDSIVCQYNKKWSVPGRCNDVTPPSVQCGPDIEVFAGPKLSKVSLTWDPPKVQDNSGLPVTVTSDVQSGSLFDVGVTPVVFTAIDSSNKITRCTKLVNVTVKRCAEYVEANNSFANCSHGNAYGSVCTTTCQQAYELVDVTTQTCLQDQTWSGKRPVCQPRSCVDPPSVAKGNFTCLNGQRYQDVCSLNCDQGYTAQPPLTITCNINVEWSQTGSCLDIQAPIFPDGCPASFEVEAASLGEPTYVNYTLPKATDNSNEPVTLLGNPISGSAFNIGTNTVTVTATDRQGNFVNCTFVINVKSTSCDTPNIDTSGKVLINYNCPNQYVYGASCLLNCTDGNPIRGASSIKCDKLSTGLQWVWSGNIKPYCNAQSCKKLNSPTNGALACDTLGVGSEICYLMCNINYTYPASAPDQYTCTKGQWKPIDYIPGCTVRRQPNDAFTKPVFYYFTQDCSANSSEIKQNFLLVLEDLGLSDTCDDGCTVDTVEITCGPVVQSRRKRAAGQFQYKIQAVIKLGKYKDQNSPTDTQQYYQTVVGNINSQILRASDAGKFNIPEIGTYDSFTYGESVFNCEPGKVIVYSTMSCAGCGPGFTYNNTTRKCDTCPQGTYQDQDISYTCTSCPVGTTTRKDMSTSVNDCQNLCLPGLFSPTGIQPCNSCPKGTFASQYGMKQCTLCPYGMSSLSTGASALTDCLFFDMRMNENTSKPAVQIFDDIPKKFTIFTWISDVSNIQSTSLMFTLKNNSDQTSACLVIDTIYLHIQRQSGKSLKKIRKWNHVAVVYVSGTGTLFVNGQMLESINVPSVSDLSKKDIKFKSSLDVKSILVSGFQMTTTAYTESQIKEFSTSCNKQVDNHVLAFKPWESLMMTDSTCNDKDLCADQPCGPYGTCISGSDDLTCACDDLWSGDRCQIDPDFCVGNLCAVGSTCINEPENRGYECSCQDGFTGALCNEPNNPVNGGWGNWSQWSSCTVTCGSGVKSRSRECDRPKPENGGEPCQGSKTETEVCGTVCRDCKWNEWTQWSCDVTCGSGTGTRTRTVASGAVNGGLLCQGPKVNIKLCKLAACPVDGGFGAWGEWSTCSSSCGGGVSTRQRSCDNPAPSLGGNSCDTNLASETMPCNNQECRECKKLEAREGQKEWNCSTDDSGLITCHVICHNGLAVMPSSLFSYQCGPTSNFTWSQQTKDNPVGLTQACSDRKIPESLTPLITTTFSVDCNKQPNLEALTESVDQHLAQQECYKNGTCTFAIHASPACEQEKRRKKSVGTVVLAVRIVYIGYQSTELPYLGGLTEQDLQKQIAKKIALQQIVENIVNSNSSIFTATIGGVRYTGIIESVHASVTCHDGSGYVGGYCVDCPAGTYSAQNGSCLYCDKGTYQDKPKQLSCISCPSGTTTSGKGSYSLAHCMTNPITFADVYPFFVEAPINKETTTSGQKSDHTGDEGNTILIVATVTGSLTFLLVLGIVIFIIAKKFGSIFAKTTPVDYLNLNLATSRSTK